VTFQLVVPAATPSLNKYAYSHWRVRQRDKASWELWLMAAAHEAGATKATGKRRLMIERHGRRALDPDNMIGGAKGAIDVLRKLGLLMDDHDGAIELAARNVKLNKGEQPHTVFVLEDM